jgi:hypothetical protein
MKFGLVTTLCGTFVALGTFELTSAVVREQFPSRNRRGKYLGNDKEKVSLGSSAIHSETTLKDEDAYWAPRLMTASMSMTRTATPTPTPPKLPPEECIVNVSYSFSVYHLIAMNTDV